MSDKVETTEPTTPAIVHTTKIVRVAGQDFQVDVAADNEAIRQQLAAQGFTDVANAKIKESTNEQGQTVVEFVKQIGTKG
jgi:hypothetical protein